MPQQLCDSTVAGNGILIRFFRTNFFYMAVNAETLFLTIFCNYGSVNRLFTIFIIIVFGTKRGNIGYNVVIKVCFA